MVERPGMVWGRKSGPTSVLPLQQRVLSLFPVHKNRLPWSGAGGPAKEKVGMKKVVAAIALLAISMVLAAGQLCHAQQPLCIFTVDPRIIYFEAEGGTAEATVIPSAPDCPFTPRTAYRWITVSSSEDLGKKVVIIKVDAAPNLAQRVGSVMVGTTQIEAVQKARDHLNW